MPAKRIIYSNSLMFTVAGLIMILLFLTDIITGSTELSLREVAGSLFGAGNGQADIIVMHFRLPKALTAILAGCAMAVSGLLMQTLFRNPLAGPDVLGVSSGAGLGVALALLVFSPSTGSGYNSIMSGWGITVAAWAGAGAVMMIIMTVAAGIRDVMTLLIIGLLLSGAISSFVSLFQYFSNETMLRNYVVWTMGNLGNVSYNQLLILSLSTMAGIAAAFALVKPLNALLMGEAFSRSVGVNMRSTRLILLAAASVLAGSVTAFCGPIAFIGIAVPHITRLLYGTSDHRILMPATALAGASVVLLSDIISALPGGGHVIPVNTVTSLIGIPVVMWIIVGRKGIGRKL